MTYQEIENLNVAKKKLQIITEAVSESMAITEERFYFLTQASIALSDAVFYVNEEMAMTYERLYDLKDALYETTVKVEDYAYAWDSANYELERNIGLMEEGVEIGDEYKNSLKEKTKLTDKYTAAINRSTAATVANTLAGDINNISSGIGLGLKIAKIGASAVEQTMTWACTSANKANTLSLGFNSGALVKNKIALIGSTKMATVSAIATWALVAALAASIMLKTMGAGSALVIAANITAGTTKAKGKGMTMGAVAAGGALAGMMVGAAMATGGVVSAPTVTLVGEGRYPEAVIPLGSSPQFSSMKEDIANAVIQGMLATQKANMYASRGANVGEQSEVVLNIDGMRLARVMLPRIESEQRRTGQNVVIREV